MKDCEIQRNEVSKNTLILADIKILFIMASELNYIIKKIQSLVFLN